MRAELLIDDHQPSPRLLIRTVRRLQSDPQAFGDLGQVDGCVEVE
jgi:hypothetical protein